MLVEVSVIRELSQNLLFGIVCRVSKNSWIKSAPYTIQALHGESMTISFDKVVIEDLIPYAMHELATTMREYIDFLTITWNRIVNFIRDL